MDGDIYFVCWDDELIPPQQDPPMDYTPAQSMQLDHDVQIEVLHFQTLYLSGDFAACSFPICIRQNSLLLSLKCRHTV